jgi:hypothetical protein
VWRASTGSLTEEEKKEKRREGEEKRRKKEDYETTHIYIYFIVEGSRNNLAVKLRDLW